jgi:hypothetical protein
MAQSRADTHTPLMLRKGLGALALVAVGSLLSGCGGGEGSVLRSGRTVVLVGEEVHGPTVGVGFGGTVVMVGNCLGAGSEGAVATIIWPHGTRITSDAPVTIEVPGLGQIMIGDPIDGGASNVTVDRLPKGIDAIPPGCPTEHVVAFDPER